MGAIDVPPAVANKKAALQIDPVFFGRAQHHAWLWLSAVARVAVASTGVIANFNGIERERFAQFGVHRFDRIPIDSSSTYVRLVGDDDQEKPCLFQLPTTLNDTGVKLELVDLRGRERQTVADRGPVENAVSIEEDRAPLYFVLSHFVCAVFSAG